MDDLLDLDAEVLHDYWSAALDWVRDAAPGTAPARVLDLGAGTGTGALGLAARFPAAEVIAVDVTTDSLRRLRAKAAGLGLAGRVAHGRGGPGRRLAGPGPARPDLGLDVATPPGRPRPGAARRARDHPAGRADRGAAEFPEPLRFLPHDVGTGEPGFEDRVITRLNAAHTAEMPTLGSAWAPRLADAGWTVVARTRVPDRPGPAYSPGRAPVRPRLVRATVAPVHRLLEPGDQATLAALLDADGPHSLLRAANLRIHGSRIVTLATRE